MPKILGLDVGDKRVGVAISDDDRNNAKPLATYNRANYQAEKQLIDIITQYAIDTIVVGLPLSEDNKPTEQSEKIQNFCRRLQRRVKINIIYIDEYMSSFFAKQRLGITGSADRKTRKAGEIDANAAAIILQDYLNQGLPGR